MPTIAAQLEAVLHHALAALPSWEPGSVPAGVVPSADNRFGDYQTNIAMTLAKPLRANPRALATQIVEALSKDPALAAISAPPEIAGAGFINFRLLPGFLAAQLAALDADEARLGVPALTGPLRIIIDFSGPNIAKPMHVGHLRSTIIGDCLARVARFLGHDVLTDNHLGDWGTQFGKVIYGWKHFLDEARLEHDPLAELVRVYQQVTRLTDAKAAAEPDDFEAAAEVALETPELANTVTATCRAELAKLQAGDTQNLAIWQRCVDLSRAELHKVYERLGIHFDLELGESYFNPRLASLARRLEKERIARPSEGALVVFFEGDPRLAERPAIIRKRDGAFNYATTDIATYEYRVMDLKAQSMWYVVGAPQALHFEQINAIARKMGYSVPLVHIPFGSILGEDRRLMRTRSGDSVALGDLLDEAVERAGAIVREKNPEMPAGERAEIARVIGLGAVKYAELSQHRLTDYVFSWDKMLAFQGNTAPYLQNAYVRIQSIFRRLGGGHEGALGGIPELTEKAELTLARKLAQYGETVPALLEDFRPNLLATYLHELANDFHGFYEACPVLKAEGPARAARLMLCRVTSRVLRHGLGLLGIEAPERM